MAATMDESYSLNSDKLGWIATPIEKLTPMTEKSFTNTVGLGKGKFGFVFLAKQALVQEGPLFVAIKYIPKQVIYDTDSKARLQQELNTLQLGNHPFIAHCFGGFETSHCVAVVMEYCYGGELYSRMQQSHKMPESHAMFYFCELALALQYLQGELKMVYRDLKPENVLLDAEGHVKLCDFGFTAPVVVSDVNGLAPLTDGCGTVMYMAPELAERKSNHSFPVDWWALGVMTYEMVVGKAPFGSTDNKNKFEVFNNITEKPVSIPVAVSYGLAGMLRGLLDKDPRKRFSWDEVRTSSWLQAVDWDLVEGRKIVPPWIPSAIDMKPGTSENFIAWDFKLPGGAALPSNVTMYCRDIKLPAGKVNSFGGKKKDSYGLRSALSFKGSASGTAAEPAPKRGARMSSVSKISPIDDSVPSTDSPSSGNPASSPTKKSPTRTSSVGLRGAPSESNLTEDSPKSISRDRKNTSISNLNAKQPGAPLLNAKQPSQKKLPDNSKPTGSTTKRNTIVQ